jgi:Right handed beta helix region
VSNTITSNGTSTSKGIAVEPTGSAVVTGVLSEVTANNNGFGIIVGRGMTTGESLNVTIVDSVASNNGFAGIQVGSANTAVMVRNVVASNSGTGLAAQTNAILRVAHSVVTGNGTGVQTFNGGTIFSYGDNDIDGNTNNNTAVLTSLAMH